MLDSIPARDFVQVYCPESFDAAVLFKDADRARYFLHALAKEKTFKKLEGFVPLKSTYLEEIMGHGYKRIIDRLAECGIIECDNHFVIGSKSKGYKLSPPHDEAVHRRQRLTDPNIVRRIVKWRKAENRKVTVPVHLHLRKWLHMVELDLDQVDVENKLSLKMILDKEFDFHVCDYGRVHHNVSRLPGKYRRYLCVSGRRMVEVDIKQSQPYFLGLLLCNGMQRIEPIAEIQQLQEEETPCSPTLSNEFNEREETPPTPVHYLRKRLQSIEMQRLTEGMLLLRNLTLDNGILDYLKHITVGDIYSTLFPDLPRDKAKEAFYSLVFGRRQCKLDQFPSVSEMIKTMKRKDYRHLSHALQRAESRFVIGTICQRIMADRPDLPIVTVHDSILSTDPDYVADIITHEGWRHGLVPTLTIK